MYLRFPPRRNSSARTQGFTFKTEGVKKPAISSACPVVVRLIGLRFPSLTDNIIHMLPPMEVAAMLQQKGKAGAPRIRG